MAGRIASKGPTNPSPNAYNTTGITVRGEEAKQLTFGWFDVFQESRELQPLHCTCVSRDWASSPRQLQEFMTHWLVWFNSFVFFVCMFVALSQKGEKKTKSGSASYSFGLRPDRSRKEGPAPNAYSVETHKLGWEFYFSDFFRSFDLNFYQDWWSCFLTGTKDESGKGICDTSAEHLRHEKASKACANIFL